MKIGSLFSGIGGLELGLEWSGIGETVWQVECDPFCRRVLTKHWPEAPKYEDVKNVGAHNLEHVDLICGGFPCQDVSAAGLGAGIEEGTRSGLWIEFARIVGELQPDWVIVENVASGARRWLSRVRRDLYLLGYPSTAVALSAQDIGAPHRRRRIFVVAAHAERVLLRQQQGRGRGSSREGEDILADDGFAQSLAHDDEARCVERADRGPSAQRQGGRAAEGCRESKRRPWSSEPCVGRVAHGVPNRVDRLKGLGNAVVTQCARVIGDMLMEVL